jgi:hypothetical protein
MTTRRLNLTFIDWNINKEVLLCGGAVLWIDGLQTRVHVFHSNTHVMSLAFCAHCHKSTDIVPIRMTRRLMRNAGSPQLFCLGSLCEVFRHPESSDTWYQESILKLKLKQNSVCADENECWEMVNECWERVFVWDPHIFHNFSCRKTPAVNSQAGRFGFKWPGKAQIVPTHPIFFAGRFSCWSQLQNAYFFLLSRLREVPAVNRR